MIVDYITNYFGAIMHIDTSKFAIAVGIGEVQDIEKAYEELCSTIQKEHAYHFEEINRHFNRMRVYVNAHFSGRDTRPPSLPYMFFGV